MKWIYVPVILIILFAPEPLKAQMRKERYVTVTGDTVAVRSKIKIEFSANSIYPRFTSKDKASKMKLAKLYLAREMEGNTYLIDRMVRVKVANSGFRQIAVILVKHPSIHPTEGQFYWINIDEALKEGAISLVH